MNNPNKMKHSFRTATISAAVILATNISISAQRMRYNFDSGWIMTAFGVSKTVTLPHAFNEDDAFRVAIADLRAGKATYEKTFRLPAKDKGKKVFIEFEGARQGATVTINGHQVGMNENGIMAFGFDITPHIRYKGDNHIIVTTDNSWDYHEQQHEEHSRFQWNDKNFNANYGGLPKHVYLHVCGPVYQTLPLYSSLHTTGTYIYASDIDVASHTATIHAETEVRNESGKDKEITFETEVIDIQNTSISIFRSHSFHLKAGEIRRIEASNSVGGLHFWSWGYGYLYTVKTRLVEDGQCIDEVSTRTGFRKTDFSDGLFRLNDRVMMVHGYAQRTSNEWPGVGMSVPAWLSDYSNGLMVQSGGNLVRWMHTTPWKQDVESCDRVGLIQAMPAGDAEKDVEGRRWEQRVEVMRDAIIYNRNNPSIIFYECGNEDISEAHMAEMRDLRDLYDPHGGRAIGSREMLGSQIAEYGGEMLYINKSAGKPVWAMEYCRDEALRRYWDDWSYPYHRSGDGPLYRNAPADDYNRNQDQLAVEHIRRWDEYWQVRPGMGKRVSSGGVKIVFSDTNTHCRGESNYRTSGVVDAMRLPKDSYFTHQVMWNGWVEPDSQKTYILGHWNYPKGTVKPIYVVSNAPLVELLVNGKSMGTGQCSFSYLHTFDSIHFESGFIEAIGKDGNGDVISRTRKETAGEPHHLALTLTTSPQGMTADGADMALVEFAVVDNQGRVCPLDNRQVSFRLDGPAEWRGGIGKGEGNCVLATTLPVECGVNRVLVRSNIQAGTIRLTAEAEGLPTAHIEWQSMPTVVNNGLSEHIQADFLPCRLDRGETPSTPSYHDIYHTVEVEDVTAGSGQETAGLSIDDNEMTEWRNDGTQETAWIKYAFRTPAAVKMVSMKLAGWRNKTYPLDIYADEKLVWSGTTPATLGYVNVPIDASTASSLTIKMRGNAEDSDAFGKIKELNAATAGTLDQTANTDKKKARYDLRIVECDILKQEEE